MNLKLNNVERFVFSYSFNNNNNLSGYMFECEGKQTKETNELQSLAKRGGDEFRDELLEFIYDYIETYVLNTEKKKNTLNILHGTRQAIVFSVSSDGCGVYYSNVVPLNAPVWGNEFENSGFYKINKKEVLSFFDKMK